MATDDTPDTPTPAKTAKEVALQEDRERDSIGVGLRAPPTDLGEQPRSGPTQEVALGGRLAALRERILKAKDVKRVAIDLSEWWPELDGQLFVTSMSAAERSRYEASMGFDASGNAKDLHNIQTKLAIRCLVDSEGNKIFGDDDVDLLAAKGAAPIQEIFEVAADLNGLTKDAIAKMEKNSEETTTDM